MKKLLIGLLALGSISAFSSELVTCSLDGVPGEFPIGQYEQYRSQDNKVFMYVELRNTKKTRRISVVVYPLHGEFVGKKITESTSTVPLDDSYELKVRLENVDYTLTCR